MDPATANAKYAKKKLFLCSTFFSSIECRSWRVRMFEYVYDKFIDWNVEREQESNQLEMEWRKKTVTICTNAKCYKNRKQFKLTKSRGSIEIRENFVLFYFWFSPSTKYRCNLNFIAVCLFTINKMNFFRSAFSFPSVSFSAKECRIFLVINISLYVICIETYECVRCQVVFCDAHVCRCDRYKFNCSSLTHTPVSTARIQIWADREWTAVLFKSRSFYYSTIHMCLQSHHHRYKNETENTKHKKETKTQKIAASRL